MTSLKLKFSLNKLLLATVSWYCITGLSMTCYWFGSLYSRSRRDTMWPISALRLHTCRVLLAMVLAASLRSLSPISLDCWPASSRLRPWGVSEWSDISVISMFNIECLINDWQAPQPFFDDLDNIAADDDDDIVCCFLFPLNSIPCFRFYSDNLNRSVYAIHAVVPLGLLFRVSSW